MLPTARSSLEANNCLTIMRAHGAKETRIWRVKRNHPFNTAGGPIAFVLREQVSQIFHSGGA